MQSTIRAQNDLGGQPAGPVAPDTHEPTLFEERVDAIFRLLVEPPVSLFTVDAQRRVFETVPEEIYKNYKYYELWLESIRLLLIERGVLNQSEIDAKIAAIEAARATGDRAGTANKA
ncbi:MAG: nitrile hydratase subunit beta [Alphaproteobacteria bacterium]|nr:nitrile hydratase subunit beta [Alphaproteobacteria bacterium]